MKKIIKENITNAEVDSLVQSVMRALQTANVVNSENNSAVQTAVQTAVRQVQAPSAGLMPIEESKKIKENNMKLSLKELRNMIREAIEECGYMDEMDVAGAAMEDTSSYTESLYEAVERKKAERAEKTEMKERTKEKDISVTVAQLRSVASLSEKQKEKFMKCIADGHTVAAALRACK
jgi:hypothetical protein